MPLERGRVPNVTLQESKDWVRYARIAFIVVYIIGGIATVRFSKTDSNIWGLITGGLGFAMIAYLFIRFILPLVLWMVKGGKGIAGAFTGRRSKLKSMEGPTGVLCSSGNIYRGACPSVPWSGNGSEPEHLPYASRRCAKYRYHRRNRQRENYSDHAAAACATSPAGLRRTHF